MTIFILHRRAGLKGRVWGLGRGIRLKSKLHSFSRADHNWKPINAFATRLQRIMGTAHNICTRVDSKHKNLCMGNWNVTSLKGKEQKLV